jgi:predicted metal-dependent hydrolase
MMSIHIDQIIHSKRKTVSLIIQSDGKLTVRAPLRMSEVHILEFVQNHADWIRKHQAQIIAHPPSPAKQYIDGELFLFLGKEYPLTISSHRRPLVSFSGQKFLLEKSQFPNARRLFTIWYKAQSRRVISQRVAYFSKQNKFSYKKIRISSARTRWGSCSSNGTLSFTWKLIMAPPEIIDYVVIHELVHTQIKNHSKKFWGKLGEILVDYKAQVQWLKQNGKNLHL